MILIGTEDFSLRIVARTYQREDPGGPYLEWIVMDVEIDVPGIQVRGGWQAMPSELRLFVQQVDAMQRDLSPGAVAVLESVEPGLRLTLRMMKRGGVDGEWRFQPNAPHGATAFGEFAVDQTYLKGLMRAVDDLASFTGSSAD